MLKRLPIGVGRYRKLVENNYYFVDKTLMIKEFLEQKGHATIITRPRRFGKSINISMMAEFFDITKNSKKLFEGTKIMETEYASEMNKYPVIYMTFANARGTKSSVISSIKKQILKERQRYKYVFENLDEYTQSRYNHLKEVLMDIKSNDLVGIDYTLAFLMERLEAYYGKKVMLFIDEYDTPFISARMNGFYDEIKSGLIMLLHKALKSSNSLQYGLLMGVQEVANGEVNNVVVRSVAKKAYNEYFGFTTEETKELLEYYGKELNDEVKRMYDGYNIDGIKIYNPWSINEYASTGRLKTYWVDTGSNVMLKNLINENGKYIQCDIKELLEKGELRTIVDLRNSYYEYANEATLWGLLVNTGYLTIKEVVSPLWGKYILQIPNDEIKKVFKYIEKSYLKSSDNDSI